MLNLKNASIYGTIFNVMNDIIIMLLIAFWHYVSFRIVIYPKRSFFFKEDHVVDEEKIIKKEKIYENLLKIKLWKDKIPQYIMKNGFSKKKISNLNIDYLKDFISETYRGEINHFICCLIIPFLFFISTKKSFLVFSILILLGNVPFLLVQRYNRLRIRRIILKLKNKNNSGSISPSKKILKEQRD